MGFFSKTRISFFWVRVRLYLPFISASNQKLFNYCDYTGMNTSFTDDSGSLHSPDQTLVLNTLLCHLRGIHDRPGRICWYRTGTIEAEFQHDPSRLMQAWVAQSIFGGV